MAAFLQILLIKGKFYLFPTNTPNSLHFKHHEEKSFSFLSFISLSWSHSKCYKENSKETQRNEISITEKRFCRFSFCFFNYVISENINNTNKTNGKDIVQGTNRRNCLDINQPTHKTHLKSNPVYRRLE